MEETIAGRVIALGTDIGILGYRERAAVDVGMNYYDFVDRFEEVLLVAPAVALDVDYCSSRVASKK